MPIIPRYNLTQTLSHIQIEISIPHVRVSTSSLELVIVDGTEFHLYAPPTYLLKLILPERVVDEDAVEDSLSCAATGNSVVGNEAVATFGKDREEWSGGSTSNNDESRASASKLLVQELTERDVTVDDAIEETNATTMDTATPITTATASAQSLLIWTKDDLPKLQYNPEKNHGTLMVILRKELDGFWPDLDLLGRLQQPMMQQQQQHHPQSTSTTATTNSTYPQSPKEETAPKSLVKVIDEINSEEAGGEKDAQGEKTTTNEKHETPTNEVMDELLSIQPKNRPTYGLFQQYSNVFRDYAREGLSHEMLECPSPDEVYTNDEGNGNDDDDGDGDGDDGNNNGGEDQIRREMRLEVENEKFDPDRYLSDLNIEEEDDMIFDSAMAMEPHWRMDGSGSSGETTKSSTSNSTSTPTSNHFFTPEESHLLATLPPKSNSNLHLSPEQRRSAFLSLVDILFAYTYDHRTTAGEPTVESSWTVMILSPSLAWLENYNPPYDTIDDVVRWCIRRSLIYPYLRSYALAMKLMEDVCSILKRGRRTVIRCLLHLHQIMVKSEAHYLFNKLYVDPLIGWVQRCEESEMQELGTEAERAVLGENKHSSVENGKDDGGDEAEYTLGSLNKDFLGLGLVELEKSLLEDCCEDDGEDDDDETSSSEQDESSDDDSDSESNGEVSDAVDATDGDDVNEDGKEMNNTHNSSLMTGGISKSKAQAKPSSLLDDQIGCNNPNFLLNTDNECCVRKSEETEKKLVELVQSLELEPTKNILVEEA